MRPQITNTRRQNRTHLLKIIKMGKIIKVVVCGMKGIGKTSILEQAIYGNITETSEFYPTIEDIYVANIESDKGTREKLRFYDTAGIEPSQTATASGTTNQQLPRHYLALADGYILVYDSSKCNSLDAIISIKKDIDRNKDKKEVTIIVLANTYTDVEESTVQRATQWCNRERIKHFVASPLKRSTLYEPFIYITSKLNSLPGKSSFTPLSMGRKVIKDAN